MSHFSVAIIHEKNQRIGDILAPYDENKVMKRYVKYTKKALIKHEKERIKKYKEGTYAEYLKDPEKYAEGCKNEGHLKYLREEFPKKLEWTDEQIYEHAIADYEEEDITPKGGVYSTYNPKSKWDWYEVGGRYANRLRLKKGGKADSARIGDVDFNDSEALRKERSDVWDKHMKESLDRGHDMEKDPGMLMMVMGYPNKEAWMNHVPFMTYAVIQNDEWHEAGSMGWWGMTSSTDEEEEAWKLNYRKDYIDKWNPDMYITIVDCHI